MGAEARERDLERGLLAHIQLFFLELGMGFAFLGSQYRLDVRDRDYYIDLVFYHRSLRAVVLNVISNWITLPRAPITCATIGTIGYCLRLTSLSVGVLSLHIVGKGVHRYARGAVGTLPARRSPR